MEKQTQIHLSTGSMLRAIILILVFVALYVLKDVVLILLTAIILASAIEPATRWFSGHGFPRVASVLTIYLSITILLIGFIYLFLPPLIVEVSGIIDDLPTYVESIQTSTTSSQVLSFLPSDFSLDEAVTQFQTNIYSASGSLFGFFSAVFGGVFSAVLIVVLSFYLAVQKDGVADFLRIITPPRHEAYLVDLWKRSRHKIGKWLQGQLFLSLIIGILVYIGLLILGVPNALLLALLAGIAEIIPLFGPIIAAVPAVLIAASDGGVSLALMTVGLYFVIQQFENHIIVPQVMRKTVGVPPLVVILAFISGAQLAGFLGMLISVPMAAIAMEFIGDIEKRKKDAREVLEDLE